MKALFISFCFISLMLSSSMAFSADYISCTGYDENGKIVRVSSYPLNNGTPDRVVTIHNRGLEYNYVGAYYDRPRTGVALWVYARGINLIVHDKLDRENFYRGTVSADHTSETYELTCQF